MTKQGYPHKQGLYDPQFERDACGIGMIANIDGSKSHEVVETALDMLRRLAHRGGQGADPASGDGAGILTQIPHELFAAEMQRIDRPLPSPGHYGVGMLFLSPDETDRLHCERELERIAAEEGQTIIGWRTVPTRDEVLGPGARNSKPVIRQLFLAPQDRLIGSDPLEYERKLYVIRRRAEREIGMTGSPERRFYAASFSSRTIVYKGLMLPEQIADFYPDLTDRRFQSALALVHSRFSTNTFPSWERAHPNRYVIHNGEINTIRGNVNWMRAREQAFRTGAFGDLTKVMPVIHPDGSDSAMLDNALEFLHLSGRSLAHAAMMLIPEPWAKDPLMHDDKRAFYEYHSCLMEPWDGPAAVVFTDGTRIGACLDRNGLRPSRYCVTKDGRIILASEAGVVDLSAEQIVRKDRLRPGQMLLVDLEQGRIVPDEELKRQIAAEHPYRTWLNDHMVSLAALPESDVPEARLEPKRIAQLQRTFGYTFEEIGKVIQPMAERGEDPVGSMGYDAPLAVFSDKPQLLYNYFKQCFAQVTNPPIDAVLEDMVTSMVTMIGPEANLLEPGPEACRKIRLEVPVLTNEELAKIRNCGADRLATVTLPLIYPATGGADALEAALQQLFRAADAAIREGTGIIILSDRMVGADWKPIPALLASAGLHHHLIRSGTRTKVSLLVESGEPREVHHLAMLLGYGINAVNPYLAFETIRTLIDEGKLGGPLQEAEQRYRTAAVKGLMKVLSKMGISTVQSYIGAQVFEAIGIGPDVIDRYFAGTPSRLGGIGLETIERETAMRHAQGFALGPEAPLSSGDDFQWRAGGEEHWFTPGAIHALQEACRTGDYRLYKRYSAEMEEKAKKGCGLRGLLEFASNRPPLPLAEVEPEEAILRRFKTGAMSFGSISKEAHETLAIAMNRIGGKSNSGEGGEEPERFIPDAEGNNRNSAVKQVASGRFGVTIHYLSSANEIQIKMAQGAKPGEGGQLPAHKVYPWIARARGSTPGVELISPPPHHDIYSIEDLAQLIYDLKQANPQARINVKLVSGAGVGTIAAGVAKAGADVILISGYDGGTGAAARTSIKHTGAPWEIGLAEAHQTLTLNGLRGRVVLETDGKLMSARDVAIAALLGAEEFGFATVPLVAIGCVMMRVCHLDTCPVGIATQNPQLREKFAGKPEHVEHFMRFVARELREIMAELGFRSVEEMVGRTDVLTVRSTRHWKAAQVDLSALLHRAEPPKRAEYDAQAQTVSADRSEDALTLMCSGAIQHRERMQAILPIANTDRTAGTRLGYEIAKRYGAEGLPDDTIQLRYVGAAGQSFGAFLPKGVTLLLEGEANDYVGKGLSGGIIAIAPPSRRSFRSEQNIVIGNVAFYGASSGEAYVCGVAGERFAVRNSGANIVVEGVGNHGCEYMTGGKVIVLGEIGRNFAAGMSGGTAYVLGDRRTVEQHCNLKMVELESLTEPEEAETVRKLIEKHVKLTNSDHARTLLRDWEDALQRFVKVIPSDYKKMMRTIERFQRTGATPEEAAYAAFHAIKRA